MRHLLATCSVLALPTLGAAQALFVPDNAVLTQPSSSALGWRSSTTGFRTQWIYDTSHFTNQGVTGPIVLTRMRFRAANASTSAGGTYPGDGITTGVNILIGTSKNDYATPSTTYGLNQGTMQQVMANGTVTVAAGAGNSPNNYVIDIPIPGGFTYDPSVGLDLLVEVDGPAFTGALPTMATGVSLAASRCTRVASTPQTATTGSTTTGFGSVILFNFIGSGGYPTDPNGDPIVVQGTATPYGVGCNNLSRSFAELFPVATTTLDLGGGFRMVPNVLFAPTTYTVIPIASAFFPHAGPVLLSNATTPAALGDDTMSQACNLGFTFPFVGGSTTVVHANTNGYIALAPTTVVGGDFTPTLAEMVGGTGTHAGLPRLFACWYDLHASRNVSTNPAAGLYFDVDVVNQKAYLTYDDFGELPTTAAGAKTFNFQVELSADGSIEVRYAAMSPFGSTIQPRIVGFSPGNPGQAPLSLDLSATMPFTTDAVDNQPLGLVVTPLILGQSSTFTTSPVPAVPGLTFNFLASVQFNPGLDLTAFGMPRCSFFVDIGTSLLTTTTVGGGSAAFNVTVPANVTFIGVDLYSQSASLDPFANAFGALLSNGVALHIGNLQ